MKKHVKHLDTVKRRAWLWTDREDYIWFWSSERDDWMYLDCNAFGWFAAPAITDPDDPTWWDRPFKRLIMNPFFDREYSAAYHLND